MISSLPYLPSLIFANFKTHLLGFKKTFWLGLMMFLQNLSFFLLWIIFFTTISSIKGWRLQEVALLFGLITSSVGLALFISNGMRTLSQRVMDSSFDSFLTKPRHPLPLLLFSSANPSSLGDILSGPFYWFWLGDMPLSQFPLACLLTVFTAIIFASSTLIFHCLSFWLKRGGTFADQLFDMLIIFSSTPLKGQSLAVRVVMFSLLPAGFIGLMPVELLRSFSFSQFAVLSGAVVFYALLAYVIFTCGVKRYRSMV